MENNPRTTHLAFVGDYVPRRCGIATFTADICEAIAAEFPKTKCIVGSVNDRPEGYDYPGRVRFEIEEQEIASYQRAAEFLNINNVEVLCAVSTDAMDRIEGKSRSGAAAREEQFFRLRTTIEDRAVQKITAVEFEGSPPGVILRSIDFPPA